MLRLLIAAIIVRTLGKETFATYSLILGILTIGDSMVDFGTTDVFVREICRRPAQATSLLRVLTATRFVQIPAAFTVLLGILLVLKYPAEIVLAGVVGASNVVFLAGVLVYRVVFRATLTMGREVTAELLSVLVIVPLLALACAQGRGLVALVACHTVSRAAFLGFCFLFGRADFRPSVRGVTWQDIASSAKSSTVMGIIGLLVGVYEVVDVLLLSKLGSLSDLAYFSGAQRLVWPLLMIIGSIGGAFYPVMASYWPAARPRFEAACQHTLDNVLRVSGVGMCSMLAAAPFYMGLLGADLTPGAAALRLLAVLCVVKGVSTALGPVLFIVHAQNTALRIVVCALLLKATAVGLLVPRFGYRGAVLGALAVELGFVAGPLLFRISRITGYRVRWTIPAKCLAAAALAAVTVRLVSPAGGLAAAVMAPVLYVPLACLTGAVRVSDVRTLLSGRRG